MKCGARQRREREEDEREVVDSEEENNDEEHSSSPEQIEQIVEGSNTGSGLEEFDEEGDEDVFEAL